MRDRRLYFVGPREVELRDEELAPPGDGELLLVGIASGISRGTELLLYRGEGPVPFDPSLGVTSYPTRYGYAWVGRKAAPSDEAALYFGLLPHGTSHVVGAESLKRVPAGLDAHRATLLANAETAVNVVWDAELVLGERIAVVGAGVVGLLVALAAMRSGVHVTLIEPRGEAQAVAKRFSDDVRASVGELDRSSLDAVVDASGDPAVIDPALGALRAEGRLVLASFHGTKRTELSFGDRFHRARLRIVSSQVSSVPSRLASRFDYARRFEVAASLLADRCLAELPVATCPFDDAKSVYERLARFEVSAPHVVFEY